MATFPDPNDNAPATTVIDKHGDILLQLGKEGDGSARCLLVSSRVLSLASTVFKAMFNGRFAEGQTLSYASPRAVSVPDDDPTLMELLCNIFHMRMSEVPDELDLKSLADFALICDKYDCREAIRFQARVWVLKFISDPDAPSFEKLLFVTYVLDLPHEFRVVTLAIVRDRKNDMKVSVATHGQDFVPSILFDRIYEDREDSRCKMISALHPDILVSLLNRSSCPKAKNVVCSWFRNLHTCNLLASPSGSLTDIRDKMNLFTLQKLNFEEACGYKHCTCHRCSDIQLVASNLMDIAFKSVQGYCLDCTIKEATGLKELKCRIAHG